MAKKVSYLRVYPQSCLFGKYPLPKDEIRLLVSYYRGFHNGGALVVADVGRVRVARSRGGTRGTGGT